ncbi:unnamed protein product, partial [Ixodes pacificus]
MQMEPEPMPTRSPSTPASIRFLALESHSPFPPMIWRPGYLLLMYLTISIW